MPAKKEPSMKATVAANLRALRAKHGLTVEKVCDKAKVAKRAYSTWEAAQILPTMTSALKLCKFYKCSTAEIFG